MKKSIIFIFILFHSFSILSQTIDTTTVNISNVWGLTLGMSKVEANVIIQKKVTVKEFLREKNRDRYIFKNVNFAGINYNYVAISFYKNKFYSIYFTKKFNTGEVESCSSTFTDIKYSLIDKYGDPKQMAGEKPDNLVWKDFDNSRSIGLFCSDGSIDLSISILYLDERISSLMDKQKKSDY